VPRGRYGGPRAQSCRGLAPSPCGAGGLAPPLPLRRGGQAPHVPMASVRQWPHRRVWCSASAHIHRDGHVCEHPQRARDPWPEASTSAKSGSLRTEYSRVPTGRALVVEAERSRVERGRPRARGPARSEGCGRTSNSPALSEVCRQTSSRPAHRKGCHRTSPENRDRRSWHLFLTSASAREAVPGPQAWSP